MFKRSLFCLLALLGLALTIAQSPTVKANGGAPNLAYVSGGGDGVSVIDVGQQKVVQSIKLPGSTDNVQLSVDARFLYVTRPSENKMSMIGAKTGEVICSADVPGEPNLLVINKNGNVTHTVYVAGPKSNTVTAIDPTNCKITKTIATKTGIHGMGFASLGTSEGTLNQLWVSEDNAVTVLNADTGETIASIPVPEGPRFVSTPPGTSAYVTTQNGKVLGFNFVRKEPVVLYEGTELGPMDYNEISGDIYVPDSKKKELVVLKPLVNGSPVTTSPIRVIKMEDEPRSIAITSDGLLGFSALANGRVAMLDIPGRSFVTTIDVGGSPRFIITGMYPPALGTTPQEAQQVNVISNVVAYVIVGILILLPVLLFRKFTKEQAARRKKREEEAALEAEQETQKTEEGSSEQQPERVHSPADEHAK